MKTPTSKQIHLARIRRETYGLASEFLQTNQDRPPRMPNAMKMAAKVCIGFGIPTPNAKPSPVERRVMHGA